MIEKLRRVKHSVELLSRPTDYFYYKLNASRFKSSPTSLWDTAPHLINIANFAENAGDRVLPVTLRDMLSQSLGVQWSARHAHEKVGSRRVSYLNRSDGLVIGGGGLFLRDTNPNQLSGWQWSCSLDALESIVVPMAVFAVGYNRFRTQDEFTDLFSDHLHLLAEKSVYIGLRNSGSIRAIKSYLPKDLHHKIRFQPCPTTVTSFIYPWLSEDSVGDPSPGLLALNCAFDRSELRYGSRKAEILADIARGCKRLTETGIRVEFYAHNDSDKEMLPYLDAAAVQYVVRDLYAMKPAEILHMYTRPVVVVGMRGHAQMIPFGCGRPSVALISHDKLGYFLEDIGAEELGIDVRADQLDDRLVEVVERVVDGLGVYEDQVRKVREGFWNITRENMHDLAKGFGFDSFRIPQGLPGKG